LRPTERAVVAGSGLFAIAQVAFLWAGGADGDLLADDAYYYFQIARNAAAGAGLSFDGLAPTNGFHPLYAWLCVPLFWIWPDHAWVPVHAALTILALCTAATAWMLFRLGQECASERAGALMSLFFLTSPFVWLLPLRGTEEALGTLLLVASAAVTTRVGRRPTLAGSIALGALLGGAMLARSEYVLWAGPVTLWWLWRTRNLGWTLACGATASLVLSPWLAWSWLHFGTIQQVSGAVKLEIDVFGRFAAPLGLGETLWTLALPFLRSAAFVVGQEFAPGRAALALALALGGFSVVALVAGGRRRPPAAIALLCGFAALHLGFYALVMRHYFVWYFLSLATVLACVLGERLARAPRAVVAGVAALHAGVGAAALVAFLSNADWQAGSAEQRVARASVVLGELPAGSRVGLWNAGAYGYFNGFHHPEIRVLNLDGLVNNSLFAAYRRGEYARWLLDEVDYVVEDLAYLRSFLGRREAERFAREHTRVRRGEPVLIEIVGGSRAPAPRP
jgi:hypothetical protein